MGAAHLRDRTLVIRQTSLVLGIFTLIDSLNVTIRKILLDYLASLPESQSFLFASDRAEHLTPVRVQHLVNRYAYNAHLLHVTPHTLRHSFCKNLIDVGVSLDKVALLAGHTSLDVTRRYTTPSEQDLQEAVEHLAWE